MLLGWFGMGAALVCRVGVCGGGGAGFFCSDLRLDPPVFGIIGKDNFSTREGHRLGFRDHGVVGWRVLSVAWGVVSVSGLCCLFGVIPRASRSFLFCSLMRSQCWRMNSIRSRSSSSVILLSL